MAEQIGQLREFNLRTSEWSVFKPRLENYYVANNIEDATKKRAIYLNMLNEEAYKLIYSLCLPNVPEAIEFAELINIFNVHFKCEQSVFAARFKFYNCKMEHAENAPAWAARVRSAAVHCKFNANEIDNRLRDQFIVGFSKGNTQDRLFEENEKLTFAKAVEIARTKMTAHQVSVEVKQEPNQEMYWMRKSGSSTNFSKSSRQTSSSGRPSNGSTYQLQKVKCSVCGRENHSSGDCFYKDRNCNICNKKGHIATTCYQKKHPGDDNMDYLENNQNQSNLPELPDSVTLELLPAKYHQESVIISTEQARNMLMEQVQEEEYEKMDQEPESLTGIHFLTDDENGENYEKKKNELLEYITRDDGSVICKLCGELLASRTHWYRHKYKVHVNNLINPAPLFKCKHCNVFFKSRKGYMGHIAARHSEEQELQQQQQLQQLQQITQQHEELNISIKEEIIDSVELNKIRKKDSKAADWEEQRIKEEKLVAAIIDRVRKECEAQGAAVTRRGYSRRSTVMMNTT